MRRTRGSWLSAPKRTSSLNADVWLKNMNSRIIAICLLGVISAGCATTHQWLVEHPKRTVRYPALAGETAGYLVGLPVALICLPITLPISAFNQDSEAAHWAPLAPVIVARDTITTLVGGGPWLIFGWWGVPESEPKTVVHTKARWPMGTYVETPAGSMVVGDPATRTGEFNVDK